MITEIPAIYKEYNQRLLEIHELAADVAEYTRFLTHVQATGWDEKRIISDTRKLAKLARSLMEVGS